MKKLFYLIVLILIAGLVWLFWPHSNACSELRAVEAHYGQHTSSGDLNHDGVVNISDLAIAAHKVGNLRCHN